MLAQCALVALCVAPGVLAQVKPATPSTAAEPAAIGPPPLHVVSRELGNGLHIVMVEDHDAPVINLQVWYHVGSKDERAGRTGFAHLFEHLMFKGSAHVAADQHSRIIEAMGGFDNAGTFARHDGFLGDVTQQLSGTSAVARSGSHGQSECGARKLHVRARSGEGRAPRALG